MSSRCAFYVRFSRMFQSVNSRADLCIVVYCVEVVS